MAINALPKKFEPWRLALVLAIFVIILIIAFATTKPVDEGSRFANTFWSLVPAILAIALALITKEVYSSLFLGILMGAIFVADGDALGTMNTILNDGFIAVLTDSWNIGILIFLVILGVVGALALKAGGTRAYGEWALKHIKTRKAAQFATFILGVLIFVDDYFNCLTVGSVMRPVTDENRVSRAKLAYLIDSTAAPICIIAPISSWAAAVTGVVAGYGTSAYSLFIDSIMYNFYAIFTIVMVLCISLMDFDFGPMKKHEDNARKGDLYTTPERPFAGEEEIECSPNGKVIDLIIPIFVTLIPCCIIGLIYTGGFFQGASFVDAFANCDASYGLVIGSIMALIISVVYYITRNVMSFDDMMNCLPKGFRNMVPAIMILIFAWTICSMTGSLEAKYYVHDLIESSNFQTAILPAIIMLVACGLAFATGTSWGTFGILLPIVVAVFPVGDPLLILGVSACLSGAVFGDHCSPISDTTIMSSAGAQCFHVNHVSTQAPYACFVAVISFIFFLIGGFVVPVIGGAGILFTIIGVVVMVAILFGIKKFMQAKEAKEAVA